MNVISFKDVWEMYRIKFLIDGKAHWEDFWALRGINLNIESGETVGLIGENGSGKSTLLKLVYGMIKPDKGKLVVSGRVSGLLDLGAGFQTELTGKENIYLIASLFGLKQSEVARIYDDIASFADIGKFINAPVKCYSQGMFVRLGFAIAIHMNPEILLIDDALSVGDEQFQKSCIKKIFDFKEKGKTILLVTHDTNMLRRLCARTVFIKDGVIIKDGLTDTVVPFYSQMFGPRHTKEIISEGDLSVIFNNGRLSFNWKDHLITPHYAGYSTFSIKDCLYRSYQADWEVKKFGENKISAHGIFYQLGISQDWEIELLGNGQVAWKIIMNSQASEKIDRGYTNLTLISDYVKWSTPFESGIFPEITEEIRSWQRLFNSVVPQQYIAVAASESRQTDIPGIIFEEEILMGAETEIFNSDYLNNYRILQFRAALLEQNNDERQGSFVFFCGKISVGKKDQNSYLERIRNDFILSSGDWKLIFNNGRIFLYFKGQPLTKDSHLEASFFSCGKRYSSFAASWQIERLSSSLLIAKGRWPEVDIEQIWRIQMNERDSFSLEVSCLNKRPIEIQEYCLQLSFVPGYTYWFSEYGQGEFPGVFQENDTDLTQRCLNKGEINIRGEQGVIPWVYVKFREAKNTFAKIFNSSFFNKSRIIRIERVEPEDKLVCPPGEHSIFKIELGLQKPENVVSINSVIKLANKEMSFIFEEGRGRLFWRGQELTKRLGFYTSLRSSGRWHDSINGALWQAQKVTPHSCTILGRYLHLPLTQLLEIQLLDPGVIDFGIKIIGTDKFSVDRIQINAMLLEKYNKWLSNDKQGYFPDFSGDCDDDWCTLFAKQGLDKENDFISAIDDAKDKDNLPEVTLSPGFSEPEIILAVLNSDLAQRGRVLQCLRKGNFDFNINNELYYRVRLTIQD